MAANELRLTKLIGAPKFEKLVVLLLLFVLLTTATAAVTSVLMAPDWGSLWRGLLLGLLLGWVLGITQQPLWKSVLIAAPLGATYALISAGKLSLLLSNILNEGISALRFHIRSPQDPGVYFALITKLMAESISRTGVILERVRTWIVALAVGEPTFDPVAATFVWIVIVWLVAAWAGWVAISRRNALLAAFPALIMSVGALSYGQRVSSTLYLMLGSTLLLLATVQHDQREQVWDKTKVAYPPRKGRQIGNTAILLSSVLVLLSAILSTVSIPHIAEWLTAQREPVASGDGSLAKSLGILPGATATPDAFEDVRNPGLPREMLIGSGPELSKRIVMTVAVEKFLSIFNGEQSRPLYWRGFTFDIYTGHGWQTSNTTVNQYQAEQLIQPEQVPHRILIEQIVRPVGVGASIVYAAGEPVGVNHISEIAWRSSRDLFGILITGSDSYQARSLVSVAGEGTLQAENQDYPDWIRQRYLSLPSEMPGRVRELALQLTASEPTPYDRVKAIEQYLRKIPYTLDVPYPPVDRDLVDFFLFDLRKGYCDYYASAMVVLSRAAGVPARFVTGYASGTYDLNVRRFMVSEADAHSWVEVYFPESGWVPFEPTASRPPIVPPKDKINDLDSGVALPEEAPRMYQAATRNYSWLVLLGILALISAVGIASFTFNEIRLRRLSEKAAVVEVYHQMRRYGSYLEVTSEPGDTPFEYADALQSRLRELSQIWVSPVFARHLYEEISIIIDRIVDTSFRYSPYQNKYESPISYQWNRLRWRLRFIWLIKYFQWFRGQLTGMIAGLTGKSS